MYDMIKLAHVENVMIRALQFECFCNFEEGQIWMESEEQHCKAKWGRKGEIIETLYKPGKR